MLVSVVLPCYNAVPFLKTAINSVLKQSYQNFELLIIDDCSKDNSFQIAKKFEKVDERVKTFQLSSNKGAAIARNKGIHKAEGDFIAFLDSDDIWKVTKIEKQLEFMIKRDCEFSYTAFENIDLKGRKISVQKVKSRVGYSDILKTNDIYTSTVMLSSRIIKNYRMPDIKLRQDLSTWLNILKGESLNACGINNPLTKYRVRDDSLSGNKLTAIKYQWKVYRNHQNLNLLESAYYFSHYLFWGMLKTQKQKLNIMGE